MARKSRKERIAAENTANAVYEYTEKIYKTALYARKSCLDANGNDDGDSITTQIFMLERYIENSPDLKLCDKYVDNGETGTNFDRPQFNRLMDDVRNGKINCIVVKDLSRFGRNYMEAGSLLETIFPYLGVRFIAINENYDSNNKNASHSSLSLSVTNLINDLYAKDISKKINSVYLQNFKQGNYMGGQPPYGYLRNPEDKHKLIIDVNSAPIVRQIFEMKADGLTYEEIAKKLNEMSIDSPSHYKYKIGMYKTKRFSEDKGWIPEVIRKMLTNEMYLGHMVQGKQQCLNANKGQPVYLPRENWYIVENTHEAIVPKELWDTVQANINKIYNKYLEGVGRYADRRQSENILCKKIICTECGKYLHWAHQCPKDYILYSYYCVTVRKDGSRCAKRYHNQEKLFAIIMEAIKHQIALALDAKKLLNEFSKMPDFNTKAEELKKGLATAENTLKKIVSRRTMLYEDYVDGVISLDDYNEMKAQYDEEISLQKTTVEKLSADLYKEKNYKSKKNKWIVEFERFKKQKTLTKDMVDALIDKIYVHGQYEIEIVFNFRDEYMYLANELKRMKGGSL